jgi:vanadium chloroperoxidase
MTMQSAALFWNDVALEANKEDHTNTPQEAGGPTYSARALALAHAAMADAFTNAHRADGGKAPFKPAFTEHLPPGQALPAAAIGGAAHAVLSFIHKRQQPFFNASLTTFVQQLAGANQQAVQGGLAFGKTVAQAILDRAATDGSNDPTNSNNRSGYVPGGLNGMHAPDPLNPGQGYYGWHYGNVRPMALERRDALAALPPPPPQTHEKRYLKDYVEVYRDGRKPEPRSRPTDEQVRVGIFWAYDGVKGIGTPPRLYNQILREVGKADGLSEAEWVVLLAQANIAMSDAGIVAWQAKFLYNVWRPIVGVRQHVEISGRSDEQQDPNWETAGRAGIQRLQQRQGLHPALPGLPLGPRHLRRRLLHRVEAFPPATQPPRRPGQDRHQIRVRRAERDHHRRRRRDGAPKDRAALPQHRRDDRGQPRQPRPARRALALRRRRRQGVRRQGWPAGRRHPLPQALTATPGRVRFKWTRPGMTSGCTTAPEAPRPGARRLYPQGLRPPPPPRGEYCLGRAVRCGGVTGAMASSRATRSSVGGWVENSASSRSPDSGFTMNMCALAGCASAAWFTMPCL